MPVLIKNCLNGKYLRAPKRWVSDPVAATNFEKTLRAWAEIDKLKLSGVQIVLNVGKALPNINLADVATSPSSTGSRV